MPTSPWCVEYKLRSTFARREVGMTILWSKSTNLSSMLRRCLTSQYLRISSAVRLRVFSNPFCMVFINFLYCRSLHPAVRIASGEMSSTLLLAPNDDNRVVDLTQLSMSSDSMISNWEGSVGNPFRSACKMAVGCEKQHRRPCATSQGSVGW